MSGEKTHFLVHRQLCPQHGRRYNKGALWVSFIKVINSTHGNSTLDLIISQRPHLPISSRWELGFHIRILGRHKHITKYQVTVQIVKAMIFPVVMYGCESWTIKKAVCWKIDAFKLWCWRRLLRVPWTARRSNYSILKEISSEYSLGELMLKLTLVTWWEELTHWKRPWCWERLRAGGEGAGRGWDGWMASPTQWTWVWASSGRWWRTGRPGMLQSMGSQRVRHDLATEEQQQ